MQFSSVDALSQELTNESEATRRLFARIPEDKLAWTPHPKSMTLGQLTLHVAGLPRAIPDLLDELNREAPNVPRPQPSSVEEILYTLDDGLAFAKRKFAEWGDEGMNATWTLTFKGRTVFTMPRAAAVRTILLNHTYHHRGMLMVYLRLLDVPLPSVYGPTADESPFG